MALRLLRTLGIILLVVLIVALGLPLAIGMGGMGSIDKCPECQMALAILGTMMLLLLGALGGVVAARSRRHAFVSSGALERPPRSLSI